MVQIVLALIITCWHYCCLCLLCWKLLAGLLHSTSESACKLVTFTHFPLSPAQNICCAVVHLVWLHDYNAEEHKTISEDGLKSLKYDNTPIVTGKQIQDFKFKGQMSSTAF